MFIVLTIVSTVLIALASARKGSFVSLLATIAVVAQMLSAFAEYGFLGGIGALLIASLVEAAIVGGISKDASKPGTPAP